MKQTLCTILNPFLNWFDLTLIDKKPKTMWDEGLVEHYQYEKSLQTDNPKKFQKREYPPKDFSPTLSEWEEVSSLLEDNMTICELGPGTGRFTDLYFHTCKKIYLVDVSEQICKKILNDKYRDYSQVQVIHSIDCRMPDIPDNSVDLFFGFGVFSHLNIEQFVGYLNEGMRILKPNGKIVIEYQSFSEEVGWKRFLSRIPEDFSNSIFRYHSTEALEQVATRIGYHIHRSIIDKNGLNGSYLELEKPGSKLAHQCILQNAAKKLDSTDVQCLYSKTGVAMRIHK